MSLQLRTYTKDFKVVALSEGMNSFGLRGVRLVAKDGEAWQAAANSINCPENGATVRLIFREVQYGVLAKYPEFPPGYEIPERLPDAPPDLLKVFFPE